jgi:FixJ family two-component response regulator
MTGTAPTVFIVDDDPSVRRSLTRVVSSAGYRVHVFASAQEFLGREPATGPCCLVLDVRMPGLTGLDLQKALADAHHRTAIVFITGHGDVATGVEAMKAGAVDFLTKPFAGKDLLDAIQRALDRDTRALDTEARVEEILRRVKGLTPRETEVFALVVTGMLNKQIAAALGVNTGTVKVHRARVMDKMHAASLAELVRLADAVGVIVPKTYT